MQILLLSIIYSETLKTPISILLIFKFMRLSVSEMNFFSFYIMWSTLQRSGFCIHSCVTWYEETRVKQALLRFSKKIWLQNSSKSAFFLESYFTYHLYSNSRDLVKNRDGISKNQISGYSFQLMAVTRFQTMSIGKKLPMYINKCHVNSDVQNRDKAFSTVFKMIFQCVTVFRQNVSLRQRHLSNWYLKLQKAYSCVIRIWV